MSDTVSAEIDFVSGDTTGLVIPAHREALRDAGTEFLTNAFRTFGSLTRDNTVTSITKFERCPGGSTGDKLFLSVEYENPEPNLHTHLFVKFSRDFADPVRDNRGKYEMESEVRFAALSRLPGFPINVPAAYFADYNHNTHTGILITERISFGTDGIEPHRQKCLDHLLDDPLPYYQAILKALARIAAAHKSGSLTPDIPARFPFNRKAAENGNPIQYNTQQLHGLIAKYADFATQCPQLLPAEITTTWFIEKLDREVVQYLAQEKTISRFLQSNNDFIALCHWNANIDNAWFWHDRANKLQCGLMDWGRVGQLNVAFALWGCLSSASPDLLDNHLEDLFILFTDEFHKNGGPRLDLAELQLHFDLYVALMFLTYFIDSPSRILFRQPKAPEASGPYDPLIQEIDTARNQLQMLTALLKLWKKHDFGANLSRLPK